MSKLSSEDMNANTDRQGYAVHKRRDDDEGQEHKFKGGAHCRVVVIAVALALDERCAGLLCAP